MKVACYSTRSYDRTHLIAANTDGAYDLVWIEDRLSLDNTAFALRCEAVCAFVNDRLDAPVLNGLAAGGTRLIVLRCAGYDQVDLPAAAALGLDVYEHEAALFFEDHSATGIPDALFARMVARPDVIVTGHQGFLTHEALDHIAVSVLANLDAFADGLPVPFALASRG